MFNIIILYIMTKRKMFLFVVLILIGMSSVILGGLHNNLVVQFVGFLLVTSIIYIAINTKEKIK